MSERIKNNPVILFVLFLVAPFALAAEIMDIWELLRSLNGSVGESSLSAWEAMALSGGLLMFFRIAIDILLEKEWVAFVWLVGMILSFSVFAATDPAYIDSISWNSEIVTLILYKISGY
ncbi:MAG: hypothetical protein AAF614_39210 [Chloroflexota bacterium]